jgi:hypothetical protein
VSHLLDKRLRSVRTEAHPHSTSIHFPFSTFRPPHCSGASCSCYSARLNHYRASSYEHERARWKLIRMLLQIVPSYVDKGAGPAVVSEFGDECFGLLDEALESCRRRFSEAHCVLVSILYEFSRRKFGTYLVWRC